MEQKGRRGLVLAVGFCMLIVAGAPRFEAWRAWADGGTWQELTPAGAPGARYGHTPVSIGQDAYLFAGFVKSADQGVAPKAVIPANDLWAFYNKNATRA